MSEAFFTEVTGPIRVRRARTRPTRSTFKVYQPDRMVLGKRMEDHLRPGVCFWHSFAWDGRDMFGIGTLDRPWLGAADEMAGARMKMAAAFEFFAKLGVPYYCFHDRDVAPEGASFAEFRDNLDALADDALGYQERTGVRLLWGTANLFTHPRYQARRRHQPRSRGVRLRRGAGEAHARGDPAPRRPELRAVGRPRGLRHAAQHRPPPRGRSSSRGSSTSSPSTRRRIGFEGQLLIEPKPMEPTKHQYDYDSQTVHGFLVRNGLDGEYQLQHRGEPRHARRAQLPPRGRVRGRQRR